MNTKLIEGKGNRKMFARIDGLNDRTYQGLRRGFFQLGHDLVRTARRQVLEKPKGGRVYRTRRGRKHTASAAGESPANLSGAYRKTFGFKIYGSSRMSFGAGSSSVPYAKFLETGTKNMSARPGLGNAVKEKQKNAREYFAGGIEKEINK